MQQIHCRACGVESLPKEPSESKLILNAPLSRAYIHGNYEHTEWKGKSAAEKEKTKHKQKLTEQKAAEGVIGFE